MRRKRFTCAWQRLLGLLDQVRSDLAGPFVVDRLGDLFELGLFGVRQPRDVDSRPSTSLMVRRPEAPALAGQFDILFGGLDSGLAHRFLVLGRPALPNVLVDDKINGSAT